MQHATSNDTWHPNQEGLWAYREKNEVSETSYQQTYKYFYPEILSGNINNRWDINLR